MENQVLRVLRKQLILFLLLYFSANTYSKGVVLCYHKVGYSTDDIYYVLPEMMEEQIKLMNNLGIKFISVGDLTNSAQLKKAVSITFDDGWKLPKSIIKFFKENRIPITLFIYPQAIGGKNFFSWEEIFELSENGFTIGSHSFSHPFLKGISQERLYKEVVYSKKYIEGKINKEVFAFAYPFGIADTKIYNLVKETYKLGFVVDDKPIINLTYPNKLSRFIIFNHTTLGQLREIIDNVFDSSKLDYMIYSFKSSVNNLEFKLYYFPTEYSETTVLIIPSIFVGPSWAKMFIEKLRQFNISSYVFVNELYSFPFYKYDVYKHLIKDLDFETISQSLKKAIDFLSKNKVKNFSIITWGDGLELFLHATKDYKNKDFISKIIVFNPLYSGEINKNNLENNINVYKDLLKNKKYDFESFKDNVKISILLHLAFFKANELTPFKKEFGKVNNLDAFLKYISKNKNLKISNYDTRLENYIESLEYSPFYPFSVVEPVSYFLGLNKFLLSTISRIPNYDKETLVIYNSDHQNAFNLISKWNKSTVGLKKDLSTVEIFLSDSVFQEIFKFLK